VRPRRVTKTDVDERFAGEDSVNDRAERAANDSSRLSTRVLVLAVSISSATAIGAFDETRERRWSFAKAFVLSSSFFALAK